MNAKFTLPQKDLNSTASDYDYDLAADTGSTGATLHFSGNAKIESTAINVQKSTSATIDSFTTSKGYFDLVLSGSANVKVHYKGSGAADENRLIVIAKADGTKIVGVGSVGNDAENDLETTSALEAGSYKIYVNGCKVFTVEAGE